MKIVECNQIEMWNKIIKSFDNWDIYFLCEYSSLLKEHGDGEPKLFFFEFEQGQICFVAMKKDISAYKWADCVLLKEEYYDLETPYGYGGPLLQGQVREEDIALAKKELENWATENKIVSGFTRFHPILENEKIPLFDEIRKEKNTVYIDTVDKEQIWENMDSTNRNTIRKALKNEIKIIHDKGKNLDEFIDIYNQTMNNNSAEEYYYFDKEYFEGIINLMENNAEFFYAIYKGKIISASIFLYNDQNMHYHLSGTLPEYKKLASTNLLIWEAANWASEKGIEKFHLGGGLAKGDSLFGFKKQFNKKGIIDFYVGKNIFDTKGYNEILNLREKSDGNFNKNNSFMIQYHR